MALVSSLHRRVVLLDIRLREGGGIIACRDIVLAFRSTAVLLYSDLDEDVYLAEAWAAEAVGFLLKTATAGEIIAAIEVAASGRLLFTPEQRHRIRNWAINVNKSFEELSFREREVLGHVVDGMSNRAIAHALSLSENTVEKHVGSILSKLEVHSRSQLISFCLAHRFELSTLLVPGTIHRSIHRAFEPMARVDTPITTGPT